MLGPWGGRGGGGVGKETWGSCDFYYHYFYHYCYHYYFSCIILIHLDIFLPVKVGEFTIWGTVRGGVWMTVGHPGLVEPGHIEIRSEDLISLEV